MANKIVSLLMQVKNKISPGVNKASEDLQKFEGRARGLEKELSKFESAQAAFKSLYEAGRAAKQAEADFDDAQRVVIRLKQELKAKKTPELALALDKAKIAAAEAKREWGASRKAVSSLQKTISKAGVDINDAAGAERKLAESVEYVNGKIKANNQQLDRVRKKLGQTGAEAEKASVSIGGLGARLAGLVGATLIIDKIKDGFFSLGESVFDVGVKFESLSKRLSAGELGYIEEFTRNTPLQLNGVSEAFIRLRAFGIDPTNGSMQALVDQNAALGGSQSGLEGVINAVGQAWSKQKLQQEEVLQLVERGVPAWDLLAQATGRTVPELQSMATAGELGRREIQLLIDELGRVNQGEAAEAMTTLGGIVSNLQDDFTAFYRRVADNGALDSLKDALVGVRQEIEAMGADGRLDRLASGISDFFSSVISWGQRAAASLNENFGNIVGTAQLIANGVGLVFNGLRAGVTGSVALISRAVAELAGLAGFDGFAEKARFVSAGFSDAFSAAASDVKSNMSGAGDALNKFGQDFQQVASTSRVAADRIVSDAARVSNAGAEAAEGTVSLGEAYERLGIVSQSALKQTADGAREAYQVIKQSGASVKEQEAAFLKYGAAAVAANGGIIDSELRLQAIRLGLREELQQLQQDQQDVGDAGEDAGERTEKGATKAAEATKQVGEAAKESSRDVQEVGSALASWFAGVRNEMQSLSAAAGAMFDNKLGIDAAPVLDEIGSLEKAIEDSRQTIQSAARDNLRLFDAAGILEWQGSVTTAAAAVRKAYSEQKLEFLELQGALADGGRLNESFLRSAENSIRHMDLLGQQDLSQLRSALDSANQKLEQLNRQSQSTLDNLQNELDRLQGNQDAIERRDYERKREELQAAIEEAQLQGNQEALRNYTKALQVLDKVRSERARKNRERDTNRNAASSSNNTSTGSVSRREITLKSPAGQSATISTDAANGDNLERIIDELTDQSLRS